MEKPLVFFICSSFVFTSLALCGCEVENIIDESGDHYGIDYITVTVQLRAHYYKYVRDNITPIIMPDAEIMLKIDKAGGLNKICYFTTDEAGYTSTCEYTLHLYREQPINMYANLQSDPPEDADYISNGYLQITWEEIYPENDFGDSIFISEDLGVYARVISY